MKKLLGVLAALSIWASGAAPLHAEAKTLDIYFVDVEGGAATLIVTPAGEAVLVDAGEPGQRDPGRIAHVAKDVAGLQQIDHCIVTHWHIDHVGGVPALAQLLPIQRYYDHGIPEALSNDVRAQDVAAYRELTKGQATVLKPGDEIALKPAAALPPLRLRVVAANGLVLGELPGASQTRRCDKGHVARADDPSDNCRSIALVLSCGDFRFFAGADLTWNTEHRLVCPENLVGKVDVFQVDHHGFDISNNPALVQALRPRVAIMNNGPRKGAAPKTFATLMASPGLEAVFQLHRNVRTGITENAPPEFVANDEPDCQGRFIKLAVDPKGKSYTVTVTGKGTSRTYPTW
ncbi:MAG: MBL fold metallo-hydrolase [Planctomycetota bacterium]